MISIDLVSGFLGAGKTTFCNYLLKHYMDIGAKPVYIVNEFGHVGLDADIIEADGFQAVEMHGGCICCTLKGEVASSVIKVIEAFSPTHIVFEPSGIFIFDDFFDILTEPGIVERCKIGNVITIVDGVNFEYSKAMFGSFLYNQIKNAPTLILSKLEKKQYDPDELVADLRNINPDAFIMAKQWIAFNKDDWNQILSSRSGMVFNHPEHFHGRFESYTAKPTEKFTQERLDELCDLILSGVFGELFRIKGVLNTENEPILLNIAGKDINIEAFLGYSEPTLTFIGVSVNQETVDEFLRK